MKTIRIIKDRDKQRIEELTEKFIKKEEEAVLFVSIMYANFLPDGKRGLVLKSDSCLVFTLQENKHEGNYRKIAVDPTSIRVRIETFKVINNEFFRGTSFATVSVFSYEIEKLKNLSLKVRNVLMQTFKSLPENFTYREADSFIGQHFLKLR